MILKRDDVYVFIEEIKTFCLNLRRLHPIVNLRIEQELVFRSKVKASRWEAAGNTSEGGRSTAG